MLENLLGSKQTVTSILNQFKDDKNLGILYPSTYGPVQPYVRLGGNERDVRRLLSRLGINFDEVDPLMFSSFPSGSMFWMRGEIMSRFRQLSLSVSDFPVDSAKHDDGTLAHAVERIVPALALGAGLEIRPFVRGDGVFHPWRGMWRITERIETDVLVVDHNIGGGANKFVRGEIKKYVESGATVVRLYFDTTIRAPTFQQIKGGKTKFLTGASGDTIALAIDNCDTREIIVNSLYGLDRQIGGIIAALERAKVTHQSRIRLMVHDFHLACPSQHLLDAEQRYCGIPALDADKCTTCQKINENIDPNWRKSFSLSGWRLQSQALIDLCEEVRFFDQSGEQILSRALQLRPEQRNIVPHELPTRLRPVKPLNKDRIVIGVLGTLQYAKGITIVSQLARYIRETKKPAKIVVVGEACGELDPLVRIHGAYDVEDLPHIIEVNRINLVFISSVVPETFCYTLGEAMEMQLPVVCFDLGAQANRIRNYDKGRAMPIGSSAKDVYQTISQCWRMAYGKGAVEPSI
jgi:glycosyltransferase involved in cell wall biosynthesis